MDIFDMECFDCASQDRTRPAVGICTTCGVAVCRSCARIGVDTLTHASGFTTAAEAFTTVRKLVCQTCATALDAHHADTYRFSPPVVPSQA
ncbi:DUF2180 family protein [Sciscionella marina]|uniref:DUF2180 family protein n=1 Tax=Sciscionella marina TaxID=508770 RepID=UPI0009FF8A2D